jgi:hypothetical protein
MTNVVRIKPYRGRKRPTREPIPDDRPVDGRLERLRQLVVFDQRSHRRRGHISLPKLKLLNP